MEKIGPKFSHLLTVRAEGPPPPYGQPDRKKTALTTPLRGPRGPKKFHYRVTPALPTKPIFGRRTNRPKMMMNDHDMMMMTMMDHLSFNEKVSLSYFWAISTIPRCAMHLWCIVSWSWVQYIFGVASLVLCKCIVGHITQACYRIGASTLCVSHVSA